MSKRRMLIGMTLAMVFGVVNFAAAADVAKIGVVNFQKILENSTKGKAAQTELKTAKDRMEIDLKKKGAEIEELRKRIEDQASVVSKEMREEKSRDVRIKVNDFRNLQKQYSTELQTLERQLMNKMQTEVAGIVAEIGKKEGYLLIISNIGVLYAPNSIDLTDKIIKKLN